MEQLFNLPKQVQKKVLDFQRKFRENPKSAGIHLEPIGTFKDENLRTARIDDKYRAIVRVPQTGDDFYLLWVDNHDEAMQWAQSKIFQWNENTQTIQVFTAPELQGPKPKKETRKAKLFDRYTDQQLIDIGVPVIMLPQVRSIIDLNEFGAIEKNLPTDAYENLFYLTDGISIDQLLFEITEGKVKADSIEEQILSINNKRSFIEVDDKVLEEILNGDLTTWQIFLHPSQRRLVDGEFKGSMKVTGGGGTGKTVVALHRLKRFCDTVPIDDPRLVLFTTFTNALTTNLRKLVEKMHIDLAKHKLINIDALARELALSTGIISTDIRILDFYGSKGSIEIWEEILEDNLSELDASFLNTEYQDVILFNNIISEDHYFRQSRLGRGKPITRKQRTDVWRMVSAYNSKKRMDKYIDRNELFNMLSDHYQQASNKPFRHIIADEIQDLSNAELRLLRSLVEEKGNDLFLVGDPYQKIYARKINFTSVGINVRGTRSKRLRINYRTSEEIKRLAISTVKGFQYDNFDGEAEVLDGYLSLFHGEVPVYKTFKTKTEETEYLLEVIKSLTDSGIKFPEIVIACRLKDSLKEIKTKLHNQKLPYFDVTSNSGDISGISLSTFHSLKGLEYKAVILSDVNNRTAPLLIAQLSEWDTIQKNQYFQNERSLLYVAITRAISKLIITGTGIKSEFIPL
jgi:superfamily I DNA/RNA helicase